MFVQAINIPIGLDIRVSNLGVGVEHTYVQAYNTALVGHIYVQADNRGWTYICPTLWVYR